MDTERTNQGPAATAPPVKHLGTVELRAEAARARAELAGTLDAIEYKLNLPKQVRRATRRLALGLRRLGEENPAALVGITLGAATAAGAAVWLGVRALLNRR
jgi:hypothetical protein